MTARTAIAGFLPRADHVRAAWAGLLALAAVAGLADVCRAAGLERVQFTAADDARIMITGYLLRPEAAADKSTPGVIALHGCGGLFARRRNDQLSSRHADWAVRWSSAGYAVLFPDSFGSRGLADVCTTLDRGITPRVRALDALGAAAWLAKQPGIDGNRMALVGWSNGGSTALWADDARLKPEAEFRAIIAFYPGCRPVDQRSGWRPRIPMTILIGQADDWTPAASCRSLAEKGGIRLVQYPDAYHDFDAPNVPVRVRQGLAFTANGNGIAHAGTNDAARASAIVEVTQILSEVFK